MKIMAYCWDGYRTRNGVWHHWSHGFASWPEFLRDRGNITASEARLLAKFYH